MAVRAASPTIEEGKSVLFTDRKGHIIPGSIIREAPGSPLYPPEIELRSHVDSPAPPESSSSSSSLPIFRFSAITPQDAYIVGSLFLSIRKDCYDGITQRFIWIDRLDNLSRRELKQIGASLMERAIEESLRLGLEGRVKVMPISGSHLFYMSCGFEPETVEYAYPECISITRFLKRFLKSSDAMQRYLSTFDPLWNEATDILAFEHKKKRNEVDIDYIRSHWYWDEHYPLKLSKDYMPFIEKAHVVIQSPRPHLYVTFLPPMMMHLPERSVHIWEKIIATPIENREERQQLLQQLRSESIVQKFNPKDLG